MRTRPVAAVIVSFVAVLASACADAEQERIRRTTLPTYDRQTGKLVEVTLDRDKNGTIDAWTTMDGSRLVASRIDLDEDGTIDRWEYYDDRGNLVKMGYSRAKDGRADAWAFTDAGGTVTRVEISSHADENRIDRWERYEGGLLVRADEDTNGDGRPDKTETFDDGSVKTAAMDEDGDGRVDRRLTYDKGVLLQIESEPDAAGTFRRVMRVTEDR